jgi:hypothetical protein
MSNETTPLTREIKIMLIEVLKAGEVTKLQAETLNLFFTDSKLIEKFKITFK